MVYFLITLLILIGLFLSLIILIQKGRGGGLAGAFGGAGGQSAFGTKAGDVFTKITVVVAAIWIVLAAVTGLIITRGANLGDQFKSEEASVAAPGDGETATAGSAEDDVEQNDFTSELSVPSTTSDTESETAAEPTENSATAEPGTEVPGTEETVPEESATDEATTTDETATEPETTAEPATEPETQPNE